MTMQRCILLFTLLQFGWHLLQAQTTSYPQSPVNQSYIPPSPNAASFQAYGDLPVALYAGTAAVNLPVYEVKCGSLSLPISLSYNYNGFFPLQEAGWVGLGWNLNAGGAITRTVEGGVDETQNSGYNYDQYSLSSQLASASTLNGFLQQAYNTDLGYVGSCWDLAPDIFDAECSGISGKFFWYQGQAYPLSYDKNLSVSWPSPSSAITITTEDGTAYTFGAPENTTSNYFSGSDSTKITFPSAWLLTTVVSADQKDTISLTYASYSWTQAVASYQESYTLSLGSQEDLGFDPEFYAVSPNVQSQVLQSIQCRTTKVNFVPSTTLRTDLIGNYPNLQEIDVYDNVTGNLVKKSSFTYEYFGSSASSPATYERLALKTFSSVNVSNPADVLTYTFSYNNETGAFPVKWTNGIDYWGYYNGASEYQTIIPPPGSRFFSNQPPSTAEFAGGSREPSLSYCLYGALATIVYPTGGSTTFTYEQNMYNSSGTALTGPGLRLRSTTDVSNNPNNPEPKTRTYTYLLDDNSSSSGALTNTPNFTGPGFVAAVTGTSPTYDLYNTYQAADNASGIGGIDPQFYYSKVTETITSGPETHKSDHYFTSYPGLYLDVRETERVDYLNTPNTATFTPQLKTVTTYNDAVLSSFPVASVYIDSEYVQTPANRFVFGYTGGTWQTHWIYPTQQVITRYDINGNSGVSTTQMTFNPTTHNLASIQRDGSDGQTIVQHFKYPEDYASGLTGNMVSARVLSPVLESQTWLKQNASDSVLIGGAITQYDQTIFKPVAEYAVETTAPIAALNNQTISGGLYTSLLSDSRYILKGQIQYDANANPSVSTKSADMNISYIWDYRHALPIAKVKNAAQADIAYTSFEADGSGNWSFSGAGTPVTGAPTGSNCYSLAGGSISKSGLTSSTMYVVSYWTQGGSSLSISGTSGSPVQGKTINGWTYYEHKVTGVSSVTVGGSVNIDELRLYPATAQMTTYTYLPSIGISSSCDVDNRVTYYQYDGMGRLQAEKDQDGNIIKTYQFHYQQ